MEYSPEVIQQLAQHGIRPGPSTRPEVIRDYLSDLYRYEIRRLRARLVHGDFPKLEYADRVVRLRLKYPLLSLPVHLWLKKA